MRRTLYLIDAYAQIFRAYYAIRGGMRSPVTSEPTQAVFGFTGMLIKLLSQFSPDYVIVAIDAPGKTFRDDLYGRYRELRKVDTGGPEEQVAPGGEPGVVLLEPAEEAIPREEQYKGTREATPDDLIAQVTRIFEVIEGFGIPIVGQAGLEADDVIATITQRTLDDPAYSDVDIRIISKDKDLEQLLGDRVTMFDIHTDTTIDTTTLMENKGITPAQVVDVLALMGDTVDNIPGVEGVGPKTAAQLVREYGSIDGILAHLSAIKGKRRENLEKARDILPISREMVTLRRDADVPLSLDAAQVRPVAANRLIPVFRQLGFNRYQDDVRRLADKMAGESPDAPPTLSALSESLPYVDTGDYETANAANYDSVTTLSDLEQLVAMLRSQPIVSVDTETTGLERNARLCGLSLAWKAGRGVYVPMLSPQPETHLDIAMALAALKPLLEDPSVPKCGHNLKFDAGVLLRHGVRLRGVVFDSMLASVLIDPSQPGHKLDNLALTHLRYRMIPIADLIGEGDAHRSIDQVLLADATVYAGEDADIALRLFEVLSPVVEQLGMGNLVRRIEAPLAPILAEMEENGILCDPVELQRQGAELKVRVDALRADICALAGCDFQIESTQQLASVLFDRMGFAAGKRTRTGRSTDITVLEKLAAEEDRNAPRTAIPRLVIEYRQLTKLIGTYLGNLAAAVDPADGRIHTSFHQLVTATGRLASHNPNLQNIPVRTETGRQIRKAFKAPTGSALICADYSQVELRLLAHLSGDPALLESFSRDQDIHALVASEVFGVSLAQVTREMRTRAKTINFGIIYGVTPFGLARRIEGLDVAAATELIDRYKQRFPGIQRFLHECIQEALDLGFVCTVTGRRRAIPEIHSQNRNTRNLGERLAINSVVQGSAADLIKAAMVNVQARIELDGLALKMLLQIHDELVFECSAEEAPLYAEIVREEMERAMTLRVPLRAECGIGSDWMSAK